MEAADVYLMYCALKAHFSRENYDYHQYGGKTKIKRDSYYKRKDRFFYIDWKRKTQSLSYTFINEIEPYANRFEELFKWEDTHPLLLREYLGKRISMETMIILDELTHFQKNWKDNDMIWKDIKKILNNYKKFLTIDKNKCKVALINAVKESNHE